ncbi:hypothetical protein EIN_410160 [Entamoeba invadens IP1]|uniref:UBX domain-containing protein n=1 Tax=Entamoeba invadens IP1 TaxID=370355 RepID=A0A0A1TWU3_ENTIV|nr:hypothetical protein EIN_410160 [Entamoeba invadens IP1]ELP85687.1 hypothetical protein EIN_410160 [Entamoeba invadens IP1]|eukprot:XP_004185033.1 hypothetical protein EIN_410160 [Entamoeba invadens IP1]
MGGYSSKSVASQPKSKHEEKIEEVDVNVLFSTAIPSLQNEIDKYKFLLERFENEYMSIRDYEKSEISDNEFRLFEKKGLEVNELHMKLLLKIDGFVGLNETYRPIRKDFVIVLQTRLDKIESMQTQTKELFRKRKKTAEGENILNTKKEKTEIDVAEQKVLKGTKKTQMDKDKILAQFIESTSAPPDIAQQYLQMCDYNLEQAVNNFFESQEIKSQTVDATYVPAQKAKVETLNDSVVRSDSRTLVLRNFVDEAKGKVTHFTQFLPPDDCSTLGDFGAACNRAAKENRWVAAYVLKETDLNQLVFIRDVIKSQQVRWVLSRSFVVWVPLTVVGKYVETSDSGLSTIKTQEDYKVRYKNTQLPVFNIHNPITGEIVERLKTNTTPEELHLELKNFLKINGKPFKEDEVRKTVISFDSSSSSDDFVCVGETRPAKKVVDVEEECKPISVLDDDKENPEIISVKSDKQFGFDQIALDFDKNTTNKDEKKEEKGDENPEEKLEEVVYTPAKEELCVKPEKEKNASVDEKPKVGNKGRVKVCFDKKSEVVEVYENYTVKDVLELIGKVVKLETMAVWINRPRSRIDKLLAATPVREAKLYPSAVLYVEKE